MKSFRNASQEQAEAEVVRLVHKLLHEARTQLDRDDVRNETLAVMQEWSQGNVKKWQHIENYYYDVLAEKLEA